MGEYHDLYLLLDVLQLSALFEEFRTICIKIYEIDPAYYLTAPSLSFDACLKSCEPLLYYLMNTEATCIYSLKEVYAVVCQYQKIIIVMQIINIYKITIKQDKQNLSCMI